MSSADVYVATESGTAEVDGMSYTFVKGETRVRAGHPLLTTCAGYFEPVSQHVHYDVEQATAGPGEKRGARATQKGD